MDRVSSKGPKREFFLKWLTASFLGSNRTKTVTTEKYEKICRYLLGDNRNTNAKFRYWVRMKGFFLVRSCHKDSHGHEYQGNQLMIKCKQTEVKSMIICHHYDQSSS